MNDININIVVRSEEEGELVMNSYLNFRFRFDQFLGIFL